MTEDLPKLRKLGTYGNLAETTTAVRTQSWIFDKPIEKLIIAGCVLWSGFSIVKFILDLIINK